MQIYYYNLANSIYEAFGLDVVSKLLLKYD